MTAIYNEIEPYPAQWMRNLIAAGHIADGVVDERSIADLHPADVSGHGQRHFFAGIGAWSHALRIAGWSLALIEQAMERRRYAHRVYIAAPAYRARAGADLCRELGIGVLDVKLGDPGSTWDLPEVRELTPSRRWNSRPVKLAAKLRPEHKTSARAGAPTGGHWTPFRETCEELVRRVRCAGPDGVTIKDAVSTKYHYASVAGARSSLATWVREGRLSGVKIESGRLYATEESP